MRPMCCFSMHAVHAAWHIVRRLPSWEFVHPQPPGLYAQVGPFPVPHTVVLKVPLV